MTELTPHNAARLLEELGVVPAGVPVTVRALSGGISNTVLAVSWERGRAVVKQSLPRLRVAANWEFDRSRILAERDCMAYLHTILPEHVPEVLASHDEDYLFVMSHAPEGGTVWKDALLRGEVDAEIASEAGRLLGLIHATAAADPTARERFDDQTRLVQGRVDPYHCTAAARNPSLSGRVMQEAERLLATRRTLVLGDYSPKNTIVYPAGRPLLLLDFEVAHWGDPAFDVAFLLTHLVLKSAARPAVAHELLAAARAFWSAYAAAAGSVAPSECDVVAELGCLLLARVDGKSPAEYLGDGDRDRVRRAAAELLTSRDDRLSPALGQAVGTAASLTERVW